MITAECERENAFCQPSAASRAPAWLNSLTTPSTEHAEMPLIATNCSASVHRSNASDSMALALHEV